MAGILGLKSKALASMGLKPRNRKRRGLLLIALGLALCWPLAEGLAAGGEPRAGAEPWQLASLSASGSPVPGWSEPAAYPGKPRQRSAPPVEENGSGILFVFGMGALGWILSRRPSRRESSR